MISDLARLDAPVLGDDADEVLGRMRDEHALAADEDRARLTPERDLLRLGERLRRGEADERMARAGRDPQRRVGRIERHRDRLDRRLDPRSLGQRARRVAREDRDRTDVG